MTRPLQGRAQPPPRRRAWEVAVVTDDEPRLLAVDGPTGRLLHAAPLPDGANPLRTLQRIVQEAGAEQPRQILCRDPDLADRLRPLAKACWCLVRVVDELPALEAARRDLLAGPSAA